MVDSSEDQLDDGGSSADEESKTKSLQRMKASLPSSF